MSWGQAILLTEKVKEALDNQFELSKTQIANLIDENVYLIASKDNGDVLYNSNNFTVKMKRKGVITLYCHATTDYTNRTHTVRVNYSVNGIIKTLTISIPTSYQGQIGSVDIVVSRGDVIEVSTDASSYVDADVSLRGKIKLKNGVLEESE